MQTFSVDLDDYLARTGLECNVAQCQEAIQQVANRYGLNGKSVVSIGGGAAHEEIGMLRAGAAEIVVYDIDEHGGLATLLPRVRRSNRDPAALTFHLCDFRHHRIDGQKQYDVVYFSSFTPDEFYREHRSRAWRFLYNTVRERLPFAFPYLQRNTDISWPPMTNPLHPVVRRAVQRFLKPGGYLLLQSYCGGVDVQCNPRFVTAIERAFGRLDVELAEGYCFKTAPGVVLWAGVRRPVQNELQLLSRRPALTRFHGRSELSTQGILKVFSHPSLASGDRDIRTRDGRAAAEQRQAA